MKLKESIKKKMQLLSGEKYYIDIKNMQRILSGDGGPFRPDYPQSPYKLVYELNIECGSCLEALKVINDMYLELLRLQPIIFCLITSEKSLSYIQYFLDRALAQYDFWVIQQDVGENSTKLFLLDDKDNIIATGDITRYPFLREEYIKKLKISNEKKW